MGEITSRSQRLENVKKMLNHRFDNSPEYSRNFTRNIEIWSIGIMCLDCGWVERQGTKLNKIDENDPLGNRFALTNAVALFAEHLVDTNHKTYQFKVKKYG